MINKKSYFKVGFTLITLVIGFIFGKLESARTVIATQSDVDYVQREKNHGKQWYFINPLLDCGEIHNLSNKTVDDAKTKVVDFIDEQKLQGVNEVSVYFRDLNNGPWFGIKEKEKFLPASLLKVPLMLSVLKQAMDDPVFLEKKFVYQGNSRNNEYFKASQELVDGHSYSVDEALSYMIKYSDNNASHLLSFVVDTTTLLSGYEDLGIPPPDYQGYAISARTYSSFFRILYNSTFLNKEYSEKALGLLSETEFDKGLVAGVPPSIKIAHKFGERQIDAATKQLHDCGIIYYPGKPYLLCVMTRGSSSFDKMATSIGQVSKIVYETVDKGK